MSFFLVLILSLNILNPSIASSSVELIDVNITPKRINIESLGVSISSESALVVDSESGKVLFSKNSERILPIASITKLVSILTILDFDIDLNQDVIISKDDKRSGGRIYLGHGERVTVEDLLYLSLVASDNQSVMSLVRTTGLSECEFVRSMNKKSVSLGMADSSFFDPTGLNPMNVSTSSDLIKLAREVFSRPIILKVLGSGEYSFVEKEKNRKLRVFSTNKLFDTFLMKDGGDYILKSGKTGYLDEAGYCFLTEAENSDGRGIIIVLLGSDTSASRFQEVKGVVDWVFRSWEW